MSEDEVESALGDSSTDFGLNSDTRLKLILESSTSNRENAVSSDIIAVLVQLPSLQIRHTYVDSTNFMKLFLVPIDEMEWSLSIILPSRVSWSFDNMSYTLYITRYHLRGELFDAVYEFDILSYSIQFTKLSTCKGMIKTWGMLIQPATLCRVDTTNIMFDMMRLKMETGERHLRMYALLKESVKITSVRNNFESEYEWRQ